MIIREISEEPDILHKSFVLLILLNDNFLDGPPKIIAVNAPQTATLARPDRESPWSLIQQSNFPEAITDPQLFLDLALHNDMHEAFLHNEEPQRFAAFLEDVAVLGHMAVLHVFGHILTE